MSDDPDPLRHVPAATIEPPQRCYHRGELAGATVCGERAEWMREGPHWFVCGYFCARHRLPSDVPIPAVHVFRRVRVSVEVFFSGASMEAPAAHREAMARLEAAVQSAGGLLDVQGVRSVIAKSLPQTMRGRPIDASDGQG